MLLAKDWKDYELLATSDGYKLERWKDIYLLRPDSQIIWHQDNAFQKKQIHAKYIRSNTGGGHWENFKNTPVSWQVHYKNLTFNIKQMGFKHTGLFPEQAVNWDFMIDKIKHANRSISVLNLFAYTGGATVACLSAGASVVHVDSSRGMVDWCKENVEASGLKDKSVRYIVDDVLKFVKREIRRGHHYDAIVMDPPSYGRGANGEVWSIEKNLNELLNLCVELLSDKPLFFLINSYTTGLSSKVLENMLNLLLLPKYKGVVTSGEVGLPQKNSNIVLPCGIYGRYESDE